MCLGFETGGIRVYTVITSDKSKKVAFVLCAIGGWLGLHQFYVGRIKLGVLYGCTFGFFMFGWVIDMLLISIGAFRDNVGAPLRR